MLMQPEFVNKFLCMPCGADFDKTSNSHQSKCLGKGARAMPAACPRLWLPRVGSVVNLYHFPICDTHPPWQRGKRPRRRCACTHVHLGTRGLEMAPGSSAGSDGAHGLRQCRCTLCLCTCASMYTTTMPSSGMGLPPHTCIPQSWPRRCNCNNLRPLRRCPSTRA